MCCRSVTAMVTRQPETPSTNNRQRSSIGLVWLTSPTGTSGSYKKSKMLSSYFKTSIRSPIRSSRLAQLSVFARKRNEQVYMCILWRWGSCWLCNQRWDSKATCDSCFANGGRLPGTVWELSFDRKGKPRNTPKRFPSKKDPLENFNRNSYHYLRRNSACGFVCKSSSVYRCILTVLRSNCSE